MFSATMTNSTTTTKTAEAIATHPHKQLLKLLINQLIMQASKKSTAIATEQLENQMVAQQKTDKESRK